MQIGFIGTGHITKSVIFGILGSKLKVNKILISKRNLNGKTSISIDNLSKSDRIKEIARMLSGKKIEDEAIVLAKKMVK